MVDDMTKKSVAARRIVFVLFILYVLAILFILVIPNNYRGHNVLVGGLTWERWISYVSGNFNLVPLRSLSEQIDGISTGFTGARGIIYLVGNIVGFVPLGYFLPKLFARQRKFRVFLFTVIPSIAVLEFVQVITMRGTCDIDDIILNTAGACAGFWMMRRFASQRAGENEVVRKE
jgi:glycopeptide antibiotics resistance protein